jgi:hypothetical protein
LELPINLNFMWIFAFGDQGWGSNKARRTEVVQLSFLAHVVGLCLPEVQHHFLKKPLMVQDQPQTRRTGKRVESTSRREKEVWRECHQVWKIPGGWW